MLVSPPYASGRVMVQVYRKSGFTTSSPVDRNRYVPGAAASIPRRSGGNRNLEPSGDLITMPASMLIFSTTPCSCRWPMTSPLCS